jgi:HSP20 family protein
MTFFLDREAPGLGGPWRPSVDIYRTPSGWVLKFDMAGVRPEDVSIEAMGSIVRVRGVRRDLMVEHGWTHHSMEIAYNRFERQVALPGEAGPASVSSEYREGMLIVHLQLEGDPP